MIASNELNLDYFVETAEMIFELVGQLHDEMGITISFVNFGGGIGITYRPEQEPVDLALQKLFIIIFVDIFIMNSFCH